MAFMTSRRTKARISRAFLFILLAVLAGGGYAYFTRPPNKAAASDTSAPKPATKPTVAEDRAFAASGGGNITPPLLQPIPPVPGKPSTPTPIPLVKPVAPKLPPAELISAPAPLIADAKAKLDAGDFLAVRNLLNDAIVNDRLTGVPAEQARALQSQANAKLIFSAAPFTSDPFAEIVKVEAGKGLTSISRAHAVPWEMVCRINGTSDRKIRMGQSLKVPFGPVHIMVSKSVFRLDLFLGGLPGDPGAMYLTSLGVGLGKDNSTPTGVWSVATGGKMTKPAWTNPRTNEHFDGYDAKNPLGGYWIALKGEEGDAIGKTSYGIHGTIEPESIGKQASMGCIRLSVEDIKQVYDMVTEGKSRVLVRD